MRKQDVINIAARACVCVVLCLLVIVGFRVAATTRQPRTGLFFPIDRERFVQVDRGSVLGAAASVIADRETGVLYLVTENNGITPLYQNDGCLMIYDEG